MKKFMQSFVAKLADPFLVVNKIVRELEKRFENDNP
jgi:hypothetical protein